jgi:hypothetical protein
MANLFDLFALIVGAFSSSFVIVFCPVLHVPQQVQTKPNSVRISAGNEARN